MPDGYCIRNDRHLTLAITSFTCLQIESSFFIPPPLFFFEILFMSLKSLKLIFDHFTCQREWGGSVRWSHGCTWFVSWPFYGPHKKKGVSTKASRRIDNARHGDQGLLFYGSILIWMGPLFLFAQQHRMTLRIRKRQEESIECRLTWACHLPSVVHVSLYVFRKNHLLDSVTWKVAFFQGEVSFYWHQWCWPPWQFYQMAFFVYLKSSLVVSGWIPLFYKTCVELEISTCEQWKGIMR